MDDSLFYEKYLRERITELRLQKNVSEHRMSLDLGRSGSYIRGITNGTALPSLRELFNIINYFELTPAEFFVGLDDKNSLRAEVHGKLLKLADNDLMKVSIFIDWLQE